MKADQHTLGGDLANPQPCPVTIAPWDGMNRRQHGLRTLAADMPQTILKHPLLGRYLRRRIHVLHRTATTNPIVRTAWRHPCRRRVLDLDQMGELILGFATETGVLDLLPGQGAVDKDGLAVLPGDAPRFVVQRLNDPDRHGRLRKSANFNNGLH